MALVSTLGPACPTCASLASCGGAKFRVGACPTCGPIVTGGCGDVRTGDIFPWDDALADAFSGGAWTHGTRTCHDFGGIELVATTYNEFIAYGGATTARPCGVSTSSPPLPASKPKPSKPSNKPTPAPPLPAQQGTSSTLASSAAGGGGSFPWGTLALLAGAGAAGYFLLRGRG